MACVTSSLLTTHSSNMALARGPHSQLGTAMIWVNWAWNHNRQNNMVVRICYGAHCWWSYWCSVEVLHARAHLPPFHLSAVDENCSIELMMVPASSSPSVHSVYCPQQLCTMDVNVCCSCWPLTEMCTEASSFLHCSATTCMPRSVKDTYWTALDNVSSSYHSFSFFLTLTSLPFHPLRLPCAPPTAAVGPISSSRGWGLCQVCSSHWACSVTGGHQPSHLLPDRCLWRRADWGREGLTWQRRDRWRGEGGLKMWTWPCEWSCVVYIILWFVCYSAQ